MVPSKIFSQPSLGMPRNESGASLFKGVALSVRYGCIPKVVLMLLSFCAAMTHDYFSLSLFPVLVSSDTQYLKLKHVHLYFKDASIYSGFTWTEISTKNGKRYLGEQSPLFYLCKQNHCCDFICVFQPEAFTWLKLLLTEHPVLSLKKRE